MTRILRFLLLSLGLALALPAHGTVPGTSCRNDATANGATYGFTFTFRADATSWVQVLVGGVVQNSGFATALNANQTSSPGGTVTFTSPPASGAVIRIQRATPLTQDLNLIAGGAYPAAAINAAVDRLAMVNQDQACQVTDIGTGLVGPQGPSGPVGSVATAGNATISGNATIGGTLGVTGVATFSAKPVAPATLAGDGATTLTTKGYVDGPKAFAWGYLSLGSAGAVTVRSGYNVASATYSGYAVDVVFTAAPTDGDFGAVASTPLNGILVHPISTAGTPRHLTLTGVTSSTGAARNWGIGESMTFAVYCGGATCP